MKITDFMRNGDNSQGVVQVLDELRPQGGESKQQGHRPINGWKIPEDTFIHRFATSYYVTCTLAPNKPIYPKNVPKELRINYHEMHAHKQYSLFKDAITRYMSKKGGDYYFIAEYHTESGHVHLHGFIANTQPVVAMFNKYMRRKFGFTKTYEVNSAQKARDIGYLESRYRYIHKTFDLMPYVPITNMSYVDSAGYNVWK